MAKKTVALVFGGRSSEHEVSVNSARNIAAALDKSKFNLILVPISKEGSFYVLHNQQVPDSLKFISDKNVDKNFEEVALIQKNGKAVFYSLKSNSQTDFDIVFPIVHGTTGEDGGLQGLFKLTDVPYVGCGILASSTSLDKDFMKRLFREAGIPSPKHVCFTKNSPKTFEQLSESLGLPFFIKPANTGSSVGVHKIKSKADFSAKLKDAMLYDLKIIAEEFVDCREIECAVLGLNESAKVSVFGEIIPKHEFYSYEAKYLDADGAAVEIPAKLSDAQRKEMESIALKTFKTMGCDGLSRIDFFMDKKTSKIYVNELNTLPGFTNISMYPKMWEASGIKYSDLISRLIDLGFEKFQQEKELQTNFEALQK